MTKLACVAVICAAASFGAAQNGFVIIGGGKLAPQRWAVDPYAEDTYRALEEYTDNNFRRYRSGVGYWHFSCDMSVATGAEFTDYLNDILSGKTRPATSVAQLSDPTSSSPSLFVLPRSVPQEIVFPGCDGASKDAGYLHIVMTGPEMRRSLPPGDDRTNPTDVKQKMFHAANFRMTISGLEHACNQVNKVEALVVKQVAQIGGDLDGDGWPDYTASDLVFTVPIEDSKPFLAWMQADGVPAARAYELDYLDDQGQLIMARRSRITVTEITRDDSTGMATIRCTHTTKLVWSPKSNI